MAIFETVGGVRWDHPRTEKVVKEWKSILRRKTNFSVID
jgi:hypothetical protein